MRRFELSRRQSQRSVTTASGGEEVVHPARARHEVQNHAEILLS